MVSINAPFDKIATGDQLERLRSLGKPAAVHPLVHVACHPGTGQLDQISVNTTGALNRALQRFPDWVMSLRSRLLDETDFSNSESALAEIRACGQLIDAGFEFRPGGRDGTSYKRPEFEITLDDELVVIEVYGRHLSEADAERISSELSDHSKAFVREHHHPSGDLAATTIIAHSTITPFGSPRVNEPGDSVLTNAISKVAAIKAGEHQRRDGSAFVIWVDLQNFNAHSGFDYRTELVPTGCVHGGAVSSGAFWYALYGRRGDIVLDGTGGETRRMSLQHNGRFVHDNGHDRSPVAAFVFSSPRSTSLFENPWVRDQGITDAFRRKALHLPYFDLDRSCMQWSSGLLEKRIEVARDTAEAIARGPLPNDISLDEYTC